MTPEWQKAERVLRSNINKASLKYVFYLGTLYYIYYICIKNKIMQKKYKSQVVLKGCKSCVLKRIPADFYKAIKEEIIILNEDVLPKEKRSIASRLTELALIGYMLTQTSPELENEVKEEIKKKYDNPIGLFK